jgi:hypothetical protein
MKSEDIQRQIESMQNSLRKAKDTAMMPSNDPALIELERIVLGKLEELEAEREEEITALSERMFFADYEHEEHHFLKGRQLSSK